MANSPKTVPTKKSVTKFIADVESDTRREDAKTLLALMKEVTGDPAVMWGPSIIGFGQYHYCYDSGHEGDFFVIGFSPRKAHQVLYVLGWMDDEDPLLDRLGRYKRGKACLYINRLAHIDLGVLEKIIKKSYRETKKIWPN
ncbi:DUF1801 domain-containing protein [Hyphococcus formosus]|uniref:DUF1801 domain-containing protein n=1 Tax=Hyphococcus formosus TaxID=3143534 RepID=UPI00398BA0FE